MRDAIMVALNREARNVKGKPTRRLNLIASKLVDLAIEGDMQAIKKKVCDHADGKATQLFAGDAANRGAIQIELMPQMTQAEWIEKYVTGPAKRIGGS